MPISRIWLRIEGALDGVAPVDDGVGVRVLEPLDLRGEKSSCPTL